MERDIDYSASDDWKYQFAKYPDAKDPDAYAHDERQKQSVLDIVATNLEAAKGNAPFDRDAISAFRQLMIYAVFGEYKTDTTGGVKLAFDDMRSEWAGMFDRLAKQYSAIAEYVYSASESQDEFFDSWYAILDAFRYTDFVQYQRGEYDIANARLQEYVGRAKTLRLKMKAYCETGVDLRPLLRDIQADTTVVANGVGFLVADRKNKLKGNQKRGKENQAKGNTEEAERANHNMQTALNRVRDRVKNGETNVLAICRTLCDWTDDTGYIHHGKFQRISSSKKYGEQYAPLTGADGEPIKPETLAKNYRTRFGTKKANKERAEKRTE